MQIVRVRSVNGGNGCENAPILVLNELKKIGGSEKGKIIEFEKLNLEEIHVDLDNISEAKELIFQNSQEIFEKNFKSFFIGGDHNITYSILNAFNKLEENPLVVVFDSHADCLVGGKNPSNREWLRKLIESGFDASKVILISSRNLMKEEIDFINKNKINVIKMDILKEDLNGICDLIMERCRGASGFYVSIDLDSVDPAFAPGVCDMSPGGMSSRELIYFIKRLSLLNNFRGGDIVEINPAKDFNNMTVKLGARLLAEMI